MYRMAIMTEKLYDLDSYVEEFECKVISLYTHGEYLAVETDRTAFFPEGGGQTSDIGFLGSAFVKDVQIECGKIKHLVENSVENVKNFTVGAKIYGKIDMKKRFSDMQQHSGEHIFSGVVHKLYGYDNVGFHLGKESVTLDFNGTLNSDDICKVESLVNKAVWDNLEIKVYYPDEAKLGTLAYRSKKEINEALRIVEIPGVDICACCAPHVKRTGEIGIVKAVGFERYKGGTRVYILCGERALADINAKMSENKKISNLLSAKETETFDMVQRLKNENGSLGFELQKTKLELLKLKAQGIKGKDRLVLFCDVSDVTALREFADIVSEKASDYAAVFAGSEGAYKYVFISKSGFDITALCKSFNARFSGRGGGRGGIAQGSVSAAEDEIKSFFAIS